MATENANGDTTAKTAESETKEVAVQGSEGSAMILNSAVVIKKEPEQPESTSEDSGKATAAESKGQTKEDKSSGSDPDSTVKESIKKEPEGKSESIGRIESVPKNGTPSTSTGSTEEAIEPKVKVEPVEADAKTEEPKANVENGASGSGATGGGRNEEVPKPETVDPIDDPMEECIDVVTEQLAMENDRLRQVLVGLSERQSMLEEFLEVEYGAKFDKFQTNRQRLVNVLGMGEDDTAVSNDGKRSAKSHELVGLLRVVKDQAASSSETSSTQSASSSSVSSSGGGGRPPFNQGGQGKRQMHQAHQGNPAKKLQKTCVRCYLTDHFIEQCPYRAGFGIDPAVQQAISQRRKQYFLALKRQNN